VKVRSGAGVTAPELLRRFEEAFSRRLGLGFQYVDSEGRPTSRRIEPHGLLVQTPVWYVLARDVDKGQPRMFRMDRILRPRLLHHVTFAPDELLIRTQVADVPGCHPLV
jgi:predicted DNA-binding transcriptional regulator YafY